MINKTHKFELMTEEMRLQDTNLDGSNLSFETLEHGGDFPDLMPQVIRVADTKGRWCMYIPIEDCGKIVRSYGFNIKYT